MPSHPPPAMSLHSRAVLGTLSTDGPLHGFAVARLLAADGPVGQVWTVTRPQVYRSLEQLADMRLAAAAAEEPGEAGPRRRRFRITPSGRRAVDRWLVDPVEHLRDVRAELLLKVLLTERRGEDPSALLVRQRERFGPLIAALAERLEGSTGTDRIVATWRYESSQAVMRTLDALVADPSVAPASPMEPARGGSDGEGATG